MAGKRKDSKGRILRKGESQRKSGTYDYRWTDKNRKQHSVYAKTLDELREKEAKIQRDISDGIDYTAGEKTVSELVDKYISFKRNARTNTLRAYSSVVNRIHASDFGKRRIKDVKKSDAQAWFVELHDSGLKRNTISVIKTVLQPAFEMAVDDDAIRKNPFRFNLSDLLPDDEQKRTSLTKTQQEKYLKFIAEYGSGIYYDDIVILLETGLRVSELYGITLADVDLDKRLLHVRRQLCRTAEKPYFVCPPKTSHGIRTIPLTDIACDTFEHVISSRARPTIELIIDGHSGFLFLDSFGKPKVAMHLENYMRYMMKKYRKLYYDSMPTVTPHVLRHTFCTYIQETGLDFRCVQSIMGHGEPDITMLYTHLDNEYIIRSFRTAVCR